jgi:hypothetical protein
MKGEVSSLTGLVLHCGAPFPALPCRAFTFRRFAAGALLAFCLLQSTIDNQRSANENRKSKIGNWQSTIGNPQSAIGNRQSKIENCSTAQLVI